MNKVFGLALVCGLLLSVNAEAARYRVDFNGLVLNGNYHGFFYYDTDDLNTNDLNLFPDGRDSQAEPEYGFESLMQVHISTTSISASFDETTAGVFALIFDEGELTGWGVGGNLSGFNYVSNATGPDFLVMPDAIVVNGGPVGEDPPIGVGPTWSVHEAPLDVSAVPLPGAVWAFGAGLLALLGLKRRRKAKMLQTATA
jgi:hypothetical protein